VEELTGIAAARPISVRWSPNLTLSYSPQDLVDRVEEDRLAKAELIEISVAGPNSRARIRFSGRHGEPGAELAVTCAGSKDVFDRLKDAVELGPWRPMSGEALTNAVGFFGGTFLGVVLAQTGGSLNLGPWWVTVLAGVVAGGLIGTLYALGVRLITRNLLPPLEIRASGVKAATVFRGVFRWLLPGLPTAIAAAVWISERAD
jgi:hypothetical protein